MLATTLLKTSGCGVPRDPKFSLWRGGENVECKFSKLIDSPNSVRVHCQPPPGRGPDVIRVKMFFGDAVRLQECSSRLDDARDDDNA